MFTKLNMVKLAKLVFFLFFFLTIIYGGLTIQEITLSKIGNLLNLDFSFGWHLF